MIPYFRLIPPPGELDVINNVATRQAWMVGNEINQLNSFLRENYHYSYSALCSNGFSSLFITLKGLELKGEYILIPKISTCFALNNAVLASGNQPLFYDLNADTLTFELDSVKQLSIKHSCKYIVIVDYFGIRNNIKELTKLNFFVIRDAAQATLNTLNCEGDADVLLLSFYATKGINGMDGGAILTNDSRLFDRCNHLIYYNHQSNHLDTFSFNFRPSNLSCAMVLNAFKHASDTIEVMKTLKLCYDDAFRESKHIHLFGISQTFLQRYVIRLDDASVIEAIEGIVDSKLVEIPKPLLNVEASHEVSAYDDKVELIKKVYLLPYYFGFTDSEQDEVISIIKNAI